MKKEQYAIQGYFFGKNYRDLFATITTSFKVAWRAVVSIVEEIPSVWRNHNIFISIGLTIFFSVLTLVRFVFGFIFTIIFSLFHIVLVTIVMAFIYLAFFFLASVDKIYRTIKKINNVCPNDGCNRKFDLPVYHCPKCGAPHQYLYPSSYGILHHRCTCGEKLPTLLINGRQKLLKTCPHCQRPLLGGDNVYSSTLFPIFGGRSSGKTCFINSAITEIETYANAEKLQFNYFYDRMGDQRRRFEQFMASGRLPESTHDMQLTSYNFELSPMKASVKNMISVADIAGEIFTSRENILRQSGYKYADAVVFVLDPLSIETFRDNLVENGYDITSYSGSEQTISDILSNMLTSLNDIYRTDKWKLSLVVALTKADIPGLDEKFNQTQIDAYIKAHPGTNTMQARDALVEAFLLENGEANALNLMKTRFSEVHYFPCSSVGKDHEEGTPFAPYGNAEPLLYVINRAYKNLNFDKKLGRV